MTVSNKTSTQERQIVEPVKLKGYEEKNPNGISYDTPARFTDADVCSKERRTGTQETRNGNVRWQKAIQTYT